MSTNSATYVRLLQRCGNVRALAEGKRVHGHIIKSGLGSDVFVLNHVILMYNKCRSVKDACHVFKNMPERNVVSWTAMIAGYAGLEHDGEAFKLFQQMQHEGVKPNRVTFINLFSAFISSKSLPLGKLVHGVLLDSGIELDVVLGTALVSMYTKCGSLEDSRKVFNKMTERNVVSWNAMIAGYSLYGYGKQAFKLFQQMLHEGVKPNSITFISLLKTCINLEDLAFGKLVHTQIVDSAVEPDVVVANALLSMYGRCRSIEDAREVFDNMCARDVISWSAMITQYAQNGHGEEAFKLFQQMQLIGVQPNQITFISLLNACATSPEALAMGKLVHGHIIGSQFESDVDLGNAIVSMYAKCASIEDAWRIFNKMLKRDVISWNAMISGFAQLGYGEEAFTAFQQMQREFVKPNKVTFISILDACTSPDALSLGKLVHAHIVESGILSDVVMGTALFSMYTRCGDIKHARRIFDKMFKHDMFSWTSMIAGYVRCGYTEEAFNLYQQMQQEGLKPSKTAFISILNTCDSPQSLGLGNLVYTHIVDIGIESDVAVRTALVSMYSKCGSLDDARRIFDKMLERSLVSWAAMICGCAQHGHGLEALKLFQQMQHEGLKPNKVIFIGILDVCAGLAALTQGKQVHAYLVDHGIEIDVDMGTALVGMYGKCGSVEDARMLFDKMPKRDVVFWSAMIGVYAQHGRGKEALQLFQQMHREGLNPNEVTFLSVLCACSHTGLVAEGLHYFKSMSQDYGIMPTIEHCNCVVDLLGRAGHLDEAEDFIKKMPSQPNSVTWMTLLSSCRIHGCLEQGKHAAERAFCSHPLSA